MNRITISLLAATLALVSCGSSSTAPKISSSSVSGLSSSVAGGSSIAVAQSSSVKASSSSLAVASSSSKAVSSSSVVVVSSSSVILATSSSSIALSSSSTLPISYGTLTDSRDGQTYKTVVIGTQTWMAQNLNYTPTSGNSWCYSNTASNCTTYGRLYDYAIALTACPTGWHLPDTTAWNTLEAYVGGTGTAGNKLKAVSTLWTTWPGITNTDDYGFSALPGGYYYGSSSLDVGDGGYWWTATANGSSNAYSQSMYYSHANVGHGNYYQTYGFSARCLKD